MFSWVGWLRDKIVAAWRYSRIIFINVATATGAVLTELVSMLPGMDWASIINNPKVLFWVMLTVNLLNTILRINTTGPVGQKPNGD